MRDPGLRKRVGLVALTAAVVALAAIPAFGQDPDDDSPGQLKHTDAIAAETGASVAEVESLRAAGAGWGAIRHAYALAAVGPMSVVEALAAIESDSLQLQGRPPWSRSGESQGLGNGGIPPGQAKKADLPQGVTGRSVENLIALHADGVGWGLIRNASFLAEEQGTTLDEAIDAIRSDNLDLQGPPPWAHSNR